jgi:hypothetical protein
VVAAPGLAPVFPSLDVRANRYTLAAIVAGLRIPAGPLFCLLCDEEWGLDWQARESNSHVGHKEVPHLAHHARTDLLQLCLDLLCRWRCSLHFVVEFVLLWRWRVFAVAVLATIAYLFVQVSQ